jgi:hypothetical protein
MTNRNCKSCGLSESAPFKVVGADSLCLGCRPKSHYEDLQPDSICPECKVGSLEDGRDGSCYCSATSMPPCSHCTKLQLYCDECDNEIIERY